MRTWPYLSGQICSLTSSQASWKRKLPIILGRGSESEESEREREREGLTRRGEVEAPQRIEEKNERKNETNNERTNERD